MTKTTTAIVSLATAATAMMAANTANAQLVAQSNVDFESVRRQRDLASSISSSHARRRLMPIDCPADQYPLYVQVAFEGTGPIDLIWTVTGDTLGTVLEGKSDNTAGTQYFTQHTEVVCVPETECGILDLSASGASLSENLVELFLGVGQPDDFNSPTASPTSSSKKGKGSGKGKGKSSSDDSSPLDDISSIRLTRDDIDLDDSAKTDAAAPNPSAKLNFCAGEVIGGDIINANGVTIFDISNAPSLAPSVSAEPSASPAPTAKSGKSSKGKGKSDDRRLHQNRSRGRHLTKN
mmetsp:Transcript_29957/g.72632  ORF Transcript_29957/g.72632 Transcript_29957/m.72632 type:complete len:293 (-) Transcript_29957:3324-4202(-)